jgi:hypothetical protein
MYRKLDKFWTQKIVQSFHNVAKIENSWDDSSKYNFLYDRIRKEEVLGIPSLKSIKNILSSFDICGRCMRDTAWCVVLHSCVPWHRIFWKVYKLRVYENTVLRKMFRPVTDKVKIRWVKLLNEKIREFLLHAKYRSVDWIKMVKRRKNAYCIWVRKPEEWTEMKIYA